MRIVSYNILDGGEGRADPLAEVIEAQRPEVVALVGVTLYRAIFRVPAARAVTLGRQSETLEGAVVFVLPNPSGRNANYTYPEMCRAFGLLRPHLIR